MKDMNEQTQQKRRWPKIAAIVALYGLVSACTTWQSIVREVANNPEPNRGVRVNHALHAQEGLDCSDCHEVSEGARVSFVNHETCAMCHDIPEVDYADTSRFIEDVSCKMCHVRDDFSIEPRLQLVSDEVKFDHQVHLNAEVSCADCHENPDKPRHFSDNLMNECMTCHAKADHVFASVAQTAIEADAFTSNECSVCHRELTQDTIPMFRSGRRIAHDDEQAWLRIHGHEAWADQTYCATCHVEQEDCTTCHNVMKPQNHTVAWKDRLHGFHAQMDSQSCSVCHEETSCMDCHMHTEPRSHRGGFAAPRNNHCVQCHVPVEDGCAVCHENIDHATAPRTPHDAEGGNPGNCAQCHPGGIPGRPPHHVNVTISCLACHQH